jgi:FkbM family methyltransferase
MTYTDRYAQYLLDAIPEASLDILSHVGTIGEQTNWDEPETPLDCHNSGVLALIEAEFAPNLAERQAYIDLAFNYFQQGWEHPLAALHYGLLLNMIGERQVALNHVFQVFLQTLQANLGKGETISPGLVYLPVKLRQGLERILGETNGFVQSYLLLGTVLPEMMLAFYTVSRWLDLASSLFPNFIPTMLKQALTYLYTQKYEGLFYLHQAQKLEPHNPSVTQALYLAYKKLQNPIVSQYWLELGKNFYLATDPQNPRWLWTTIGDRDDFTYIFFQESILLAVLPDLAQVVTIVLLADGDWFEGEMEFWNGYIQPGMTVIDVGANVGVYTFSAAREVGEEGKVIAIEPFAPCVTCLEETKRVNNLSQVVIKQAAASDRSGTLHLATFASSEFNAVTTDTDAPGIEVEAIALDDLIQTEGLTRVDVLKIDAEGHELAVLQGSEKLLDQFAPVIMYENISAKRSNTDVAIYLQERGYKLYYYRPFLCQMLPITDLQELEGELNIIARKD